MAECRILYFRGGILEEASNVMSGGLIDAARTASSTHPDLTAEIWLDGRKAGFVRPSGHGPHAPIVKRPRLPVR